MTKKNGFRLSVLFSTFLIALWTLDIASAHKGHKHRNAPVSAKKLKNPLKANEETIAAGRALFNKHCASCHGEDGKAKTEIAAAMKKKPTDLTAKEMRGITDGEIYWVTTNGIKKSGMPAFKSTVTDQERWRMTVYIKHLMGEHPHAEHGGKSPERQSGQQAGGHATLQNHDAHHAGVNERGDKVMGFDHDKTAHHFRLKTDGGLIEVEAKDASDTTSRDQIRSHLRHIARKFASGDFTAPMLIHAKTPPGVPVMKQLRSTIRYQFEETERGGRVRVITSNTKALAAVHEFLRFQISDHRTGDSEEVEKS
jgi:mono/diheme cytochrome c family protein